MPPENTDEVIVKMPDEPNLTARRKCVAWLKTCLELGWPKSALDDLEALWWKYHDNRGRLIQ